MDPHHRDDEFGVEIGVNDDASTSGILNTLISSPFLSNRVIKLSSILGLFPIHHLLIGLKNRRCIGAELAGRSGRIIIRYCRYQLCSAFVVYQHTIIKIGSIGVGIRNICNTTRRSLCRHLSIIPDHFLWGVPIGMWRKKIESHFRNGYFSPQMDGCDF
jgi:hypothetical protein